MCKHALFPVSDCVQYNSFILSDRVLDNSIEVNKQPPSIDLFTIITNHDIMGVWGRGLTLVGKND